jgi:hypothetical protein
MMILFLSSLLSTFLGALDDDFALACLASSLLWLT